MARFIHSWVTVITKSPLWVGIPCLLFLLYYYAYTVEYKDHTEWFANEILRQIADVIIYYSSIAEYSQPTGPCQEQAKTVTIRWEYAKYVLVVVRGMIV